MADELLDAVQRWKLSCLYTHIMYYMLCAGRLRMLFAASFHLIRLFLPTDSIATAQTSAMVVEDVEQRVGITLESVLSNAIHEKDSPPDPERGLLGLRKY